MELGSDVSPSPEAQGQMDPPALENLLEDLYALNKLYGLLQRTKADEDDLPRGKINDVGLDEKSRNLFMKLLDSATQQALQDQAKIVTRRHHHASTTGTAPDEPPLLLSPNKDEQWNRKEDAKEQERGESHQALQKGTGADEPLPPPKQSVVISTVSTADQRNRCPRSDLKRLNSNRSTASRLLRDQKKPKNLHKTSSSSSATHGQLLDRHRSIHHPAKRASMNRSLQGGERRHRVHADHFISMSSRQSTMSPSKASTGSTQRRNQVKAAAAQPRPEKIGATSFQFNAGSAADELAAGDGKLVMDARVKTRPPLLPSSIIAKEPQRSGELTAAKDRTCKRHTAGTKAEHARREKLHRHQKKCGIPNPPIILRKQPSHRGARPIPSSAPHESRDDMLKKNGEVQFGNSLRRKPPSTRKTCRQSTSSSSYSSSSRSSEATGSSQPSRRINSISPRRRVTTSNRVSHNIRPSKQKGSAPCRSLSRHRVLEKHPRGPMRPTRSVRPTTKERAVEEKEGRLTRLKNKLSIVFHHHHHVHRGKARAGYSSEDGETHRHRSMWEYLWGIVHRKHRVSSRVASRHQHGHLYALLEGLIHHVFAFAWRRRKAAALPRAPTRRIVAKKVRWWQRLSRRTRLIGTRRTRKKARLRLTTGRT